MPLTIQLQVCLISVRHILSLIYIYHPLRMTNNIFTFLNNAKVHLGFTPTNPCLEDLVEFTCERVILNSLTQVMLECNTESDASLTTHTLTRNGYLEADYAFSEECDCWLVTARKGQAN